MASNPYHKLIPKPWGHEVIFTPERLERTGKLLYINAGCRLSLQYHEDKEETLCLLSGQATLWMGKKQDDIQQIPMEKEHGYTVYPKEIHRIQAITNCVVAEVSSPEIGTTVRIEDDYSRPDETEKVRNETDRGWKNGQ